MEEWALGRHVPLFSYTNFKQFLNISAAQNKNYFYVIYVDMKNFGNYVQPTHLLINSV